MENGLTDQALTTPDITATVKTFILERFLPGEDPQNLTTETPLLSGGVLDSISTIELISFLEKHFGVKVEAYEIGEEHLDTLTRIAATVQSKLATR